MKPGRALLLILAALLIPAPAVADEWVRQKVPWEVVSVGSELGTLRVQFDPISCFWREPHATVHETGEGIRIAVTVERFVASSDGPCPPRLVNPGLLVPLRHTVGGRRIVGGPRLTSTTYWRFPTPIVPRLIDLDYRDAREVLRAQGLRVRFFGAPRGRVAFQSPARGTQAKPRAPIGLTLGRHTFHTRALRRCVARPGVVFRAGRPDVGDEDAPDLELIVSGEARALVALYADPARGRERLPSVRRRAKGYTVERAGLGTIVWFSTPDPAVRSCVAGAKP